MYLTFSSFIGLCLSLWIGHFLEMLLWEVACVWVVSYGGFYKLCISCISASVCALHQESGFQLDKQAPGRWSAKGLLDEPNRQSGDCVDPHTFYSSFSSLKNRGDVLYTSVRAMPVKSHCHWLLIDTGQVQRCDADFVFWCLSSILVMKRSSEINYNYSLIIKYSCDT